MASYHDIDDDENTKKVPSGGGGLQGQRPPALKIGKSSCKIKKRQPQQQQQQLQAAGPVIIYIRSPEVIHVEACNFRNLVQQLTGKSPPPSSSAPPPPPPPPPSKANYQLAFGCTSVEVAAEDVVREGRDDQEPAAVAGVAGEADGGGLMQLQHDGHDREEEGYNQTMNWSMHEAFPSPMANNNIPPLLISPNVYANLHDFGMISCSQGFHDDTLSTYPRFNP